MTFRSSFADRLRALMERAFAPYRRLSPGQVELSGMRVMQRLRQEPMCESLAPLATAGAGTPAKHFPMRSAVPLAAAIVLVVAVGTAVVWRPADPALYRVVEGDARIGDTIRSNGGAGAVLSLSDGSRVEMRSNSELVVERATDGIRIRLHSGGIIVSAAEQRTGHLYVQTKDMTVSVVGTVFVVNADDNGSRVAVVEGEVRVTQGATEQKLRPGERVATSPQLERFSVASEVAWSRRAQDLTALLQRQPAVQPRPAAVAPAAQNDRALSFEVASVRLTAPQTRVSQRITETRVDLIGIQLRSLLWMAFNIDLLCCRSHLSAPDWTANVRVDVVAAIPAGGGRHQVPEMLKSLLIQRFGLRTHVEPRFADGYELLVANGGIRMKEVEPGNDLDKEFPVDPAIRSGELSEEMLDGRRRVIPIPFGNRIVTETSTYEQRFTPRRTQQIDAARMTMAEIRSLLVMSTGRPVIDGTTLTGVYSFSVELPVEAFAETSARIAAQTGRTIEPSGVSALQAVEQLGLKLEPRRLPVDTIVVDHIERVPTEN